MIFGSLFSDLLPSRRKTEGSITFECPHIFILHVVLGRNLCCYYFVKMTSKSLFKQLSKSLSFIPKLIHNDVVKSMNIGRKLFQWSNAKLIFPEKLTVPFLKLPLDMLLNYVCVHQHVFPSQ